MNQAIKEKKLIFGDIDIQPLINMEEIMSNSFKRIEEEEHNELEEMGIIKGFEISYELSWKILKRILNSQGVEALSPREVFRLSAQFGYIKDTQTWFDFGKERNLTTHVYDENAFTNIINFIPKFLIEFRKLIKTLKTLK